MAADIGLIARSYQHGDNVVRVCISTIRRRIYRAAEPAGAIKFSVSVVPGCVICTFGYAERRDRVVWFAGERPAGPKEKAQRLAAEHAFIERTSPPVLQRAG